MLLPSLRQLALGLYCTLISLHLTAQITPIELELVRRHEKGASFTSFTLFNPDPESRHPEAQRVAPHGAFLTLDLAALGRLHQEKPENILLHLPYHGQELTAELYRCEVVSADFSILTEQGPQDAMPAGLHYRGVLRGTGFPVAFSFFEEEVMGLCALESGNMVLGQLQETGNRRSYILYNDNEMGTASPFQCYADDKEYKGGEMPLVLGAPQVAKCVRVFLEADNELFVEKGSSVQATVNYLTGMYNQVAALYQNEQINTVVSQIFVWTTPDVYTPTSSATVLNQFRTFRTQYNADLAHLVGMGGNNLGGIAYVDVLCTGYGVAFSDIAPSFSTVPTYSWTVEVVTHEMGHNLGSNHTQWCGWPGGAIDNCVNAEGSCAPGPTPVNGGTIMSYCHLTNIGINFNNGFGTLPGATIRNEVSGASCLASSCPETGACAAPVALTITNISGAGAVIGWENISGAAAYTLRYRVVGSSAWITVNNAVSPHNLTALTNNEEYEVTVQSNCGSAVSDYRNGILFKTGTNGGSNTCGTPFGVNAGSVNSYSALVSWQAVSGASSYQIQWTPTAATSWSTPVTITGTSYAVTGLASGTAYTVRVSAMCSGLASAYGTTTFSTSSANTCTAPNGLGATPATNSAQLYWGVVPGAGAYQLEWKAANATSWSSPVTLLLASYALTGLNAQTAYQWRVATVCSSGNSAYATGSFTTAAPASCGMPFGLGAAPTATGAQVTWNAVAGVGYYQIQWKAAAATAWSAVQNTATPSWNITGLAAATQYQVRVRSVCATGSSGYAMLSFTTTATATCGVPGNVTTTPSTNSALVYWGSISGAFAYQIQWKTTAAATWGTAITVSGTSYTITGLNQGTTYQVRVRTQCTSGNSDYANGSFTTTVPVSCGVPSNVSASPTATTAQISWGAVSGATQYFLQWKAASATAWGASVPVPGNQFSISGLTSSTVYQVRVQSVCPGAVSSWASGGFTTSFASSCNSPVGLSVSAITWQSAQISWNVVAGATQYQLQWKRSGTSSWSTANTTTTTRTLSGLLPATAYDIRVRTVCSTGVSGYVNGTFATIADNSADACDAPQSLALYSLTATAASIQWSPVSGAASYTLQVRLAGYPLWFTFTGLTDYSVNVQNLQPNTAYQVVVYSYCNGANSAASDMLNFTTPGSLEEEDVEERFGGTTIELPSATPSVRHWQVKAAPNPVRDITVLHSLDGAWEAGQWIEVWSSLSNELVLRRQCVEHEPVVLDMSEQPSGVYFVKSAASDGRILSLRIVKI